MDKLWSDDAWNDYLYWQIQDKDRHLFGPFLLIVYILLRYSMGFRRYMGMALLFWLHKTKKSDLIGAKHKLCMANSCEEITLREIREIQYNDFCIQYRRC